MLADAGRLDEARARLDADGAAIRATPVDSEWVLGVGAAGPDHRRDRGPSPCRMGLRGAPPASPAVRRGGDRRGVRPGPSNGPLDCSPPRWGGPATRAHHFDAAARCQPRRRLAPVRGPNAPGRRRRPRRPATGWRQRWPPTASWALTAGSSELERLPRSTPGQAFQRLPPGRRRVDARRSGARSSGSRTSRACTTWPLLLARPGREVAAVDLAGMPGAAAQGDLGEVVDAQARDAYKARLVELERGVGGGRRRRRRGRGRPGRKQRARGPRRPARRRLRPRRAGCARTGDSAERARQAVAWRIRDALGADRGACTPTSPRTCAARCAPAPSASTTPPILSTGRCEARPRTVRNLLTPSG